MEIELIQDGKGVDYNKYRDVIENVKESLFRRNMGKETKEWIYISNFVGILFDKNRLILSLPKSVIIKEDVDKETLLYKYARLFDLYFMVNEKKCDLINKYESIENWCNQAIKENKTTTMTQEIITFKFEMVFEWMIGEFFHNQISIQKGDVLFNSQLLDKEITENPVAYPSQEVLNKCETFIDLGDKIKLYDIEYTDDENLLYPKIKNINVEKLLKYDFSKLGRYKRSNWSFQEECRYGIFLAPWNMQYMEEMKNICRNNRDNAEKFITEAMNLLENPNTIIPSKRFYVDFDEEILKDLKILLGPKVTEAEEEIVRLIVKEYCPTAQISKSKLKIS